MKKSETWFRFFIRYIYNLLILGGVIFSSYLVGKYTFERVVSVDSHLRTLSPYAYAELNLKETASGLRGGRIPKPVYVQILLQVWRDFKPVLAKLSAELYDAYLDTREVVTGKEEPGRRGRAKTAPRAELKTKCNLELTSWFTNSPTESKDVLAQVQVCLTKTFQKKPDFVAVFNKELEAKEEALKPRGPSGPKPGQKSLIVLAFILALVAAVFGAWKIYQGFLGGLAAQELARMLEELEQRIRQLGPDFFDEEPDVSEALVDLDINYNQARNKQFFQHPEWQWKVELKKMLKVAEEEEWATISIQEEGPRPVTQFDDDVEAVAEFAEASEIEESINKSFEDDVEYQRAELVEEGLLWATVIIELQVDTDDFLDSADTGDGEKQKAEFSIHLSPDSLCSALEVLQVVSDELQAVDREPDPEPELCYLGMSVQENLMEKARIGITLLLEEEPTEDNIFVTGYTQDKEDPLKFVFWKKRLRDLREDIKRDALAKLKAECPTLFNMGWFTENLPKDESQLSKEEEELKKENDEIAAKLGKRNIEEEIKKKVPSLSKERQLNDGTFVPLDKKF